MDECQPRHVRYAIFVITACECLVSLITVPIVSFRPKTPFLLSLSLSSSTHLTTVFSVSIVAVHRSPPLFLLFSSPMVLHCSLLGFSICFLWEGGVSPWICLCLLLLGVFFLPSRCFLAVLVSSSSFVPFLFLGFECVFPHFFVRLMLGMVRRWSMFRCVRSCLPVLLFSHHPGVVCLFPSLFFFDLSAFYLSPFVRLLLGLVLRWSVLETLSSRLLKRIMAGGGGGNNFIFSPLSIHVGLAMMSVDASGASLKEILGVVGASSRDELTDQSGAGRPHIVFVCGHVE